jgi:hypothetical protein
MAIATVVQRGNLIQALNEKGQTLFIRPAGSGPNDGLKGYTSTTVTIQIGTIVYTINERGHTLFVTSAGK